MKVRPIDIADATLFTSWFAAHDAALRHDFPDGVFWFEHELRVRSEPSSVMDYALLGAIDDGDVLGTARVEIPLTDNLSTAFVHVAVPAEARRRGVGTALLEAAESVARDRGRTRFMAEVEGPLDPTGAMASPGTRFAEHHGYTRRIVEILRAQRAPFDLDHLAELERAALPYAVGYQIITWRDRVPDEHVDEYCRLMVRMSTDAPLGELDYEQEVWDADRIRVGEARQARMRRGAWCAVAVASDGTFAGVTEVSLPLDADGPGFQDETIVDPRHRGHRLGLLLKIANLRRLLADRPGLQSIWTGNADSNTFMNAINAQLGYVPAGWILAYQRDE